MPRIIALVLTTVICTSAFSQNDLPVSDPARKIVGTWTKISTNPKNLSWTNPVIITATISGDGGFSERFGHTNALVYFKGTWLLQDHELALTITSAHGTGDHLATGVGKTNYWRILNVSDHELAYEAGGHTNKLIRVSSNAAGGTGDSKVQQSSRIR